MRQQQFGCRIGIGFVPLQRCQALRNAIDQNTGSLCTMPQNHQHVFCTGGHMHSRMIGLSLYAQVFGHIQYRNQVAVQIGQAFDPGRRIGQIVQFGHFGQFAAVFIGQHQADLANTHTLTALRASCLHTLGCRRACLLLALHHLHRF